VFVGGIEIPAPPPEARVDVDFVEAAEAFYVRGRDEAGIDPTVDGFPSQQPLVHAVWLRAKGRDDLAGHALAQARGPLARQQDAGVAWLRRELVRQGQSRVVEAYLERADVQALAVGEWLRRQRFTIEGEAAAVVARLEALRDLGRLGAGMPERPGDWAAWSEARQLAWALEALPELSAPRGPAWQFLEQPLAQQILRHGEAAVPALIDLVAHGGTVSRWRGFTLRAPRRGRLIPVRELALQLLHELLGLGRIESSERWPGGDRFFAPVEDPEAEAQALRGYWQRYGAQPLLQRLVAMLDSDEFTPAQCVEAAWCLARLGPAAEGWRLNHARLGDEPAAARAILAAYLRGGELSLLGALAELRDLRVGPEVAAAASREGDVARAGALAWVAALLGERGPWIRLVDQVAAGTAPLGEGDGLDDVLSWITASGVLGASAVRALCRPEHPWHERLAQTLLGPVGGAPATRAPAWTEHGFALRFVERLLTDESLSGGTWVLDQGVARRQQGRAPVEQLPRWFGGAAALRGECAERVCDEAGRWAAEQVLGAPQVFHPLRLDRDSLLARIRDWLTRYRFRAVTLDERTALGMPALRFVPLLPLLEGPATEADVAAGRAVFHRPESVGPAWIQLPAVAALAGTRTRVLVVQGEVDAEGAVTWGVLGGPQGVAVVAQDALDGEPVPLDEVIQGR
jgi:hypothetical protein